MNVVNLIRIITKNSMDFYSDKKIVFFDGVCNLCNGFVQFIIKRNTKEDLFFASLQSQAGIDMIRHFDLPNDLSSVVFIDQGKVHIKSSASLSIIKNLCCWWPVAYGFIVIPAFIRNAVYAILAKYRYLWFGKQESCMLPSPALKHRFLA